MIKLRLNVDLRLTMELASNSMAVGPYVAIPIEMLISRHIHCVNGVNMS